MGAPGPDPTAVPTANVAKAPSRPAVPPVCASDCYRAPTGAWQDAAAAYAALHDTGEPRRARVLLGIAAILGVGSLWYWIDDRNIADWDEPALRQRFTGEAWRMDNNGFPMNFAYHPGTGAAYYAVARASDLSVAESALYSFLGSFFWEFVLEFKEKISINDTLATPGGGITLGEFAHKLGEYLNSAPQPRGGQRALAWTLGPAVSLDRALDREPPPTHAVPDRLGYASELWHDFRLAYAVGAVDAGGRGAPALHAYELRGELVSIPGYRRPGRLRRGFGAADLTSLALGVEQAARGAGFWMVSDTTLFGYLAQDLGFAAHPRGVTAVVGAHLGYRYATSHAVFDESFAALHFPGPGLELHATGGGVSAELRLRAALDFGALAAPAYPAWSAAHPDAREKSILRKQQYHYVWGGSTASSMALTVGRLRLSHELFFGSYDSIEGLDRTQDRVTDDVDAVDRRLDHTTQLEILPPRSPVAVGGFVTGRSWRSRVGDHRADVDYVSVGARLSAAF